MAVVDANGLPIGLRVCTAGEHEVKQAQDTVLECWTVELPQRTIADRAFDSDALDTSLAEFGVEVIAPHRKNRKPENKTQDGRKLRRYKRRWKVERFFSWLGNFGYRFFCVVRCRLSRRLNRWWPARLCASAVIPIRLSNNS